MLKYYFHTPGAGTKSNGSRNRKQLSRIAAYAYSDPIFPALSGKDSQKVSHPSDPGKIFDPEKTTENIK